MHFRCQQQQKNAVTIHHSIATARQKELRSGANVNQDRGNEFLESGGIVNVYNALLYTSNHYKTLINL